MQRSTGNKRNGILSAALLVAAAWTVLAHIYPPLIVPSIPTVVKKVLELTARADTWAVVGLTAWRLLAGLALGVAGGIAAGAAFGHLPRVGSVCQPLLGLAQAVPPVSWLVLALIWFGFNGRPSVFIVALSALPVVTINLTQGIAGIDPKLLEMAAVYSFGALKRLRYIEIPSVLPYFRASLRVAAGTGCKAVVMGEVLTTSSGVGGAITDARLALEPESVIAWTILILLLYSLLDFLAARIPCPGDEGKSC